MASGVLGPLSPVSPSGIGRAASSDFSIITLHRDPTAINVRFGNDGGGEVVPVVMHYFALIVLVRALP